MNKYFVELSEGILANHGDPIEATGFDVSHSGALIFYKYSYTVRAYAQGTWVLVKETS